MKINQEQTERLYRFTREHYVEWYDLQTELVDHLANAIEAQWQENPTISFEEALQKEFKKFGVFGFMDVVDNRKIALNKKYNKLVWRHFREFFGFPKIVMSIGLTTLLYFGMSYINATIMIGFLAISMFGTMLLQAIKNIRYQNRKTKDGEKRWLFLEVIRSYGNISIIFIVPVQLLGRFFESDGFFENKILTILLSFIFVVYGLGFYVIFYVIPSKAQDYPRETYPEYDLV